MQLKLNLASRAYVNRRGLYGFYAFLGVFLLSLLAFNLHYTLGLRAHAATLSAQLAALEGRPGRGRSVEPEVNPAELEKRRRDVAFANEILKRDGYRWTVLLDDLENVIVDGVSIRSINPDYKENSLDLTAVARDVENMQQFLDSLLSSAAFSEVYLLNQTDFEGSGELDGGRRGVAFSVALKRISE